MAGEWIKMRVALTTCPKVAAIARAVGAAAGDDFASLPRSALRLLVIGGLHTIWAAVNEHTSDGVMRNVYAEDLDDIAGLRGIGEAMAEAGWLEVDESSKTLTFPNFDQWNTCGKDTTAAERMRKHREKRTVTRNERNAAVTVTRNVAQRVTVDKTRQDKREEEEVATTVPPQERRKRSQPADGLRWSPADGWQGIEDVDRTEWAAAFPACDLAVELAKAHAWCKGNPAKAHKSNWRAFLVRWLNTAQNSGGTHRTAGNRQGTGPPPTPPERKRFYRADAAKNLTDDEYRAWRANQRPAAQLKEVS